jgi:hypothetical protein
VKGMYYQADTQVSTRVIRVVRVIRDDKIIGIGKDCKVLRVIGC